MCDTVAIPRYELPDELIARHGLGKWIHSRGETGNLEIWFHRRERNSLLPVWLDGEIKLLPWGSQSRSCKLPLGSECRQEELEAGSWSWLNPVPLEIIATSARSNGYWYAVPQGIRGIAVKDYRGKLHAYMLTTTSTVTFTNLSRSKVEPVFLGPQI